MGTTQAANHRRLAAAERRAFAFYSDFAVARASFFPDLLLAVTGGRESSTVANCATYISNDSVGQALALSELPKHVHLKRKTENSRDG